MVYQIQSAKPELDTPVPLRQSSGGGLSAKLLLLTLGSAIIGLGGLAFVVYQELLTTAKRELQQRVSAQAQALEAKLTNIQQATQSLASGAQILFRLGSRTPQAYEQLLETVSASNSEVLGFGLDQQSPQLVRGATTFSSYWLTRPQPRRSSRPIQNDAQRASGWTEPVKAQNALITTFSIPIFDPADKQKVIGVASADVDVSTFGQLLASEGDGYVVLASAEGKLLAFPPEPNRVMAGDTVQTIPALRAIWAEGTDGGVGQRDGNLFAHRKLGSSQWRLLGVLPEATVRDRLLLPVLGATAGVGLLLTIVALWLASYLKQRVRPLVEQCDRLTVERGGKPTRVLAKDELEQLQLALRQLIDQLARYEQQIKEETARAVQTEERQKIAAQLQQEAEASEQEVGLLLEVVSSIEEGDLTVEAEVSDRATGLVADTLNRLRERLAETIARVLATAQQVATGAEELQVLARTVAANTVEQAQSVAQGTALTEQVAASAKSSAEQVKIANQALQEVQKTVESAQSAITKLTEGIEVLQKGSAQIVQRMKTLGEFVGLAEQFVQDQSQIASLTQVLAINATLVAARAAEQRDPKQFIGVAREFEAIAEQVNALATQTNQGLTLLRQRTGQIQAVVSAVDTEVQSLGGLVARFTSGVEQSATAFQSVRQVTEQVVQVGRSVTSSSLEIATAADSTAKYMSEIATLAGQTADLTATARQKAETMGSIAQQLLAGIRFFRLPEAMLASAETPSETVPTYDIASQEIGDHELDEFEEEEWDFVGDNTDITVSQAGDRHVPEEVLATPAISAEGRLADNEKTPEVEPADDLADFNLALKPESEAEMVDLDELELEDSDVITAESGATTATVMELVEQAETSTSAVADDLELADFNLALEPEPEAEMVDLEELELEDTEVMTTEQGEALVAEQSEADTFAFAFSEPMEQAVLESSTADLPDDPELADFNLALKPESEAEMVDLDELELEDSDVITAESGATTATVMELVEQAETSTSAVADDLELADFNLALEPEPEAEMVDLEELELEDTEVMTTEQGEALVAEQSEADTFAFAFSEPMEQGVSESLTPDAPESGDFNLAREPELADFDKLEDSPSSVASETQQSADAPDELQLLIASGAEEPEIPMNSEFDALVAELEEQSRSQDQEIDAMVLETLTEHTAHDGGQFAEDDFEEFISTLSEEDDGGTPFNIDFLVEENP
jgi:methyl-accepting chemotaxis protein